MAHDNYSNKMREAHAGVLDILEKRPGLWLQIAGCDNQVIFDGHQVFPYFDEVNAWISATKDAAQLGLKTQQDRMRLKTVIETGTTNLAKLGSGEFIERRYSDVLSDFPVPEIGPSKSPFYANKDSSWAVTLFDRNGRPNLRAIVESEQKMLDALVIKQLGIEQIVGSVGLQPHLHLLVLDSRKSRPSKSWLKRIRQAFSRDELSVVLHSLESFSPFDPVDMFASQVTSQHKDPNNARDWFLEEELFRGKIWSAHLAGEDAVCVLSDVAMKCYERIPSLGPLNMKLGNAAIASLAMTRASDVSERLLSLRERIGIKAATNSINKALERIVS